MTQSLRYLLYIVVSVLVSAPLGCGRIKSGSNFQREHSKNNFDTAERDPFHLLEGAKKAQDIFKHFLSETVSLRRNILRDLLAIRSEISEEDLPVDIGEHLLCSYQEKGRPYPEIFLTPKTAKSKNQSSCEEIYKISRVAGEDLTTVIDINQLKEIYPESQLLAFRINQATNQLAIALAPKVKESTIILVKDIESPSLPSGIRKAKVYDIPEATNFGTLEWSSTGNSLLYTVRNRDDSSSLLLQRIAEPSPKVIYSSSDPDVFLSLKPSRDGTIFFITKEYPWRDDILYLPSDLSFLKPKQLLPKISQLTSGKIRADVRNGEIYYIENAGSNNARLLKTPLKIGSRTAASNRYPVLIYQAKSIEVLTDIETFRDFAVVSLREKGRAGLAVFKYNPDINGAANNTWINTLQIPSLGSDSPEAPFKEIKKGANLNFKSKEYKFGITSLTKPERSVNLHLSGGEISLSSVNSENTRNRDSYFEKTVWAKSYDGTEIPISLAWNEALSNVVPRAVLLIGYGAYGSPAEIKFTPSNLLLMDRGIVIAVAHTRGGGEFGSIWHATGSGTRKLTAVRDYLACAHILVGALDGALVGHKHKAETNHDYNLSPYPINSNTPIFGFGRSAGGALVAAAAALEPELFKGVILEAPYIDLIAAGGMTDLPFTEREFSEWGNPRLLKDLEMIKEYAPLELVKKIRSSRSFPATFIQTAEDDQIVPSWHSFKLVQALNRYSPETEITFAIRDGTSHQLSEDSYTYNQYKSDQIAWMFHLLN